MRATNRKQLPDAPAPSQLFVLPPAPSPSRRLQLRAEGDFEPQREQPPPTASFQATLQKAAETEATQRRSSWPPRLPFHMPVTKPQRATSSVLTRAWTWLHGRYTLSTTKRLRVAETVALGEKRFVSLISVGGQEFLIGGGTGGVSLLATLGTPRTGIETSLDGLGLEGFGLEEDGE